MPILQKINPKPGRQKAFEYGVGGCIAVACGLFLTAGLENGIYSVITLSLLLCLLVGYFIPAFIMTAHFLAFILPAVLMICLEGERAWAILPEPVGVSDLVFGVIFVALGLKLSFMVYRYFLNQQPLDFDMNLGLGIAGLGGWFLFQIIRNLDIYGLSAPGEFRNHYIVLVIPLFIALFFDSRNKREVFFSLILLFSLFVPVLCMPAIAAVKGLGIGPGNRFFPADISFGILQGLIFCLLGKKYKMFKMPLAVLGIFCLAGMLVIIFDSHRSVWFPFFPMVLTYFWLDRARMGHSLKRAIELAAVGGLVVLIASLAIESQLDKTLGQFVLNRGKDILVVDDPSDSTWAWRISRWESELEKAAGAGIVGTGFGEYWGDPLSPRSRGVFPHNLYIQIFIKMGLVGLILYLGVILRVFYLMVTALKDLRRRGDPEAGLVVAGIVSLVGSHVHYLAYSFDPFSLFFMGLAMAVVNFNNGHGPTWSISTQAQPTTKNESNLTTY